MSSDYDVSVYSYNTGYTIVYEGSTGYYYCVPTSNKKKDKWEEHIERMKNV